MLSIAWALLPRPLHLHLPGTLPAAASQAAAKGHCWAMMHAWTRSAVEGALAAAAEAVAAARAATAAVVADVAGLKKVDLIRFQPCMLEKHFHHRSERQQLPTIARCSSSWRCGLSLG